MNYRADFHIHSCLSPCGSLEMSPAAIVQQAKEVGLNAIALSDHNCALNLPAFGTECERQGMECLYGIEVTSMEEAHILCLFDQLDAAMGFGEQIYDSLPDIPNNPEKFGDQPVLDENEDVLDFVEKFLISASSYDISSLVTEVHGLGGLIIPAHIDRSVYGIIAQLGFLPDEPFDAVELTAHGDKALALDYPIIRSSDSHFLNGLGTAHTPLEMESLTVKNLRSSLWNRQSG
ncbi:PHP domain-containing protein [Pontiellaceae bacterium B12227]|nr:PHP domain-containing protein [Pontiellaceae bacterium B12227]